MSILKPTAEESSLCAQWVRKVFSMPAPTEAERFGQLKVLRQGWGFCRRNRSIENCPMTIGKRTFTRGLATHAVSRIAVTLPAPAILFTAAIGRDQNPAISEQRAAIEFLVETDGCECYRSGHIHGGEKAIPIRVPLNGATEFVLHVRGEQNWGHADWAMAQVTLADGKTLWLDEFPFSGVQPDQTPGFPCSFRYGNAESHALLDSWPLTVTSQRLDSERTAHTGTRVDPRTGLQITLRMIQYHDFPAVEWTVYFKNTGRKDTPILEDIQALDTVLHRAAGQEEWTLFRSRGSYCEARDFEPIDQPVGPSERVVLSGKAGRSSGQDLPFMNLKMPEGGVLLGVGWSGQWSATFQRDAGTGLTVRAGMERTHLKLHPGEEIRTPGILLFFWRGEALRAHNLFRRFMLARHTPKQSGRPVTLPVSMGQWGMVATKDHAAKIKLLLKHKVPFEHFWIDAGWYGDCKKMEDWIPQAGTWSFNKKLYPNGLEPLTSLLARHGKRMILWFDPERACDGSQIHRDHPGWLTSLKNTPYFLFDFGNPAARRWITDHIAGMIESQRIDIYRHDSNVDPLEFWRKKDRPDRQGIAEIRHIEGVYTFWDDLRRRFPNLIIDNCSSGGQRLDFEALSRTVPLWRTDWPGHPHYHSDGSQSQTHGLSWWLPVHAIGLRWPGDTYDFHSTVGAGLVGEIPGLEHKAVPAAWLKKHLAIARSIRDYYRGDYYPLTNYSLASDVWLAYQFDRPDLASGVLLAFRRETCPYPVLNVKLRGLRPGAYYRLKFSTKDPDQRHRGSALMNKGIDIRLNQPHASALVVYRRESNPRSSSR